MLVKASLKVLAVVLITACSSLQAAEPHAIGVIYPTNETLFPPDLAPPTFVWKDTSSDAKYWRLEIRIGRKKLKAESAGPQRPIGEIDQRCAEAGAVPPSLPADEAEGHSWKPDAELWEAIKKDSLEKQALLVITGHRNEKDKKAVSAGEVSFTTSRDPVGAPIFYRDVPLIPVTMGERGVIQPLPPNAVPLIAWRLKHVNETGSRKMMEGLPTCANCHSFSRDGKTMGMDVDGPQNDKGLYGIVPVRSHTSIKNEYVIRWSWFKDEKANKRFGFMSQVSPDSQYVVTSVASPDAKRGKGLENRLFNGFYKDYGFGQVFFPTRDVLAWYSKASGKLQTLPGANDPDYVQTGAFWSPDGKWLIFSRAVAKDAYAPDQVMPTYANDPNETQIQYDLYRIPFNEGRGGVAEPIRGASQNGMSNNFPKVSPDGKWIVFVKNKNGLLMRPDSELWIVPFEGGEARRLKSNLSRMNSWHTFSPNGRWLAFSSKGRSLYTELFLTHIDEDGNASPAVLVENATAANRAVNIPEFVNVKQDELLTMDAPATDFYQLCDKAVKLSQEGKGAESVQEWRKAIAMEPEDAKAHFNLAVSLQNLGQIGEAMQELEKSIAIEPDNPSAHVNLGVALVGQGRLEEGIERFRKALTIRPGDPSALSNLGAAYLEKNTPAEAAEFCRQAVESDPEYADARNCLGISLARQRDLSQALEHLTKAVSLNGESMEYRYNLGRVLAASGSFALAIPHFEKAVALGKNEEPMSLDMLAAMYFEVGRYADAVATEKKALAIASRFNQPQMVQAFDERLKRYESLATRN